MRRLCIPLFVIGYLVTCGLQCSKAQNAKVPVREGGEETAKPAKPSGPTSQEGKSAAAEASAAPSESTIDNQEGGDRERVAESGQGSAVDTAVSSKPNSAEEAREKVGIEGGETKVRPAILAGSWYDLSPEALASQVQGYMSGGGGGPLQGYPIALIVPHAGYRFSGPVAGMAYRHLANRSYGRVFVLAPSHRVPFQGIALPEATHYETPLGKIPIDGDAISALERHPLFNRNPIADTREHSIEIQLPFLQSALGNFKLVPLMVSGLGMTDLAEVSDELRKHIRPGDLVIASSDFTHFGPDYGYMGPPGETFQEAEVPQKLKELLDAAWTAIGNRDMEGFMKHKIETEDTICGCMPIALLLSVLPADAVGHRLASDMSARIVGDWENSVSYLAAAFTGLWPYDSVEGSGGLSEEEKHTLLRLARYTAEFAVREGKRPSVEAAGVSLTPRMGELSGAFVTLKKQGNLRGCIGNIEPVKPLVDSVVDNAISAALNDRRFEPVSPSELSELTVEVSVLTPPVKVGGHSDIVLGRDGVIIERGGHAAVFLPQVAPEQGWTLPEMLDHLSAKAGLPRNAWREPGTEFKVFQAIVFHETDKAGPHKALH